MSKQVPQTAAAVGLLAWLDQPSVHLVAVRAKSPEMRRRILAIEAVAALDVEVLARAVEGHLSGGCNPSDCVPRIAAEYARLLDPAPLVKESTP